MRKIHVLKNVALACSLLALTGASYADGFKRFSVSAGWLHVSSMGKTQPFHINTSVNEGTNAKVGLISGDTIMANLDQEKYIDMDPSNPDHTIKGIVESGGFDELVKDVLAEPDPEKRQQLIDTLTGVAEVNGISAWTSNAGLEVEDVDTLGLMFNYNINQNISLQLMGGIPPKVDLKGKGQVYAPFSATGHPLAPIFNLYMKNDLLITDLGKYNTTASARAWTPALQAQYYFGKPGINKFRPFVGGGFMYAYFNDIEINKGVKSDLIAAGHMIQNIHDGQAGAALEGKVSRGDIRVKVDADDAFAPMVSAGFTYDINPSWFATASVSYAKMDNTATITVVNNNDKSKLISAKTKIDIDPLITYVGVGYRF